MTRNEKKAVIESMAEKFMNIDDLEGKSMTIMVMSAYAEGKAAGKAEERRRWEQKEAVKYRRNKSLIVEVSITAGLTVASGINIGESVQWNIPFLHSITGRQNWIQNGKDIFTERAKASSKMVFQIMPIM